MSINPALELQAQVWREQRIPILSVEKAEWLHTWITQNKPQTILELGTAVGYSGVILASEGGKVTTVDCDLRALHVAKETFAQYEVDATILFGDGIGVLKTLINAQEKYDLIFIDFGKALYLPALVFCLQLLKPTGTIIADNVTNPKCADFVAAIKKYNTSFIEIGDGLSVTTFN